MCTIDLNNHLTKMHFNILLKLFLYALITLLCPTWEDFVGKIHFLGDILRVFLLHLGTSKTKQINVSLPCSPQDPHDSRGI